MHKSIDIVVFTLLSDFSIALRLRCIKKRFIQEQCREPLKGIFLG